MEGGGFFCAAISSAPSLDCAAATDDQLGVSAGDPYGPQVAEGLRRRRRKHRQRAVKTQKSKQKKGDKTLLLVRLSWSNKIVIQKHVRVTDVQYEYMFR